MEQSTVKKDGENFVSSPDSLRTNQETEVQNLLKIVLEAQTKTQQTESEIEQAKKTFRAIKDSNDERVRKIQEENRELDSQLGSKEIMLNKAKIEIESQIWEARAKLLRRIVLCNLKNLVNGLTAPSTPEKTLSTIYTGRFITVYDDIVIGSKPVNKYEWIVRVKLAQDPDHEIGKLSVIWPTYNEIHWGYGNELEQFYQRDFKSEEEAKAYAERNKARICQQLIEGIKQVEKEIETANGNIDEVFDFRLHTNSTLASQYSGHNSFKVVSAEKNRLVITPTLSKYDIEVEKTQLYTILVTQQIYQLTITGHRFSSQARDIKYALYNYFGTNFKVIESDTQQEVQDIS